jgi:uncharacterized protein
MKRCSVLNIKKRNWGKSLFSKGRDNEPFPIFKYMPDPVAAGSIVESNNKCVCCGRMRGYIYLGPIYCIETLDNCLCPWCIANGSVHDRYDASFTDIESIGRHSGREEWDPVTIETIEEVAFRTPGFNGLQQEQWWSHCNDAAEFIEIGGYEEIIDNGKELEEFFINQLRNYGCPEEDVDKYIKNLDKNGSPIACIFKCRHCGIYGGYIDVD